MPHAPHSAEPARRVGVLQVIQSIAWSFFGVQSSRNRRRDFSAGNPWHYIVAAVLMTGLVVLVFATAAQLAIRHLS